MAVRTSQSTLTHKNILEEKTELRRNAQSTLVQGVPYDVDFLPFTTHPNASNCFLCVSSNRALLTVALVATILLYSGNREIFTGSCLSDILLFDQLSTCSFCPSGPNKPIHYQCLMIITLSRLTDMWPPLPFFFGVRER